MTAAGEIGYRRATEADLATCETIFRESLNGYLVPLGQYEIPADNPALRAMHAHMLATDPARFWVATRRSGEDAPGDAEEIVGFTSAIRRGPVWFLSNLFVRPEAQASGVGRGLVERIRPDPVDDAVMATVTDAAQPISNGLYASMGMVPRLPMFNLVGRPTRPEALRALPTGIHPVRLDATAPIERDRLLETELAALDGSVLGYAHPQDHDFIRGQGRVGFAYRDGGGEMLGYGYGSELGRIGPVATRDAGLVAPIVAHLLDAVTPRGASAIWVPGQGDGATEMLLHAGLRMDGFPVLLCWNRPFADFGRYLPFSPGLP